MCERDRGRGRWKERIGGRLKSTILYSMRDRERQRDRAKERETEIETKAERKKFMQSLKNNPRDGEYEVQPNYIS